MSALVTERTTYCPVCHGAFLRKSLSQVYCSERCRSAATRRGITVECHKALHVDRIFECRYCRDEVVVTDPWDKREVYCCELHEKEYWRQKSKEDRKKNIDVGHVVRLRRSNAPD